MFDELDVKLDGNILVYLCNPNGEITVFVTANHSKTEQISSDGVLTNSNTIIFN